LVFALLSGDDAAVRATASLDINDLVTVLVAVGVGVVDASLPAIIMLFVFEQRIELNQNKSNIIQQPAL
jgi:hypothetical protein